MTNSLIGCVRHPWASQQPSGPSQFPIADPRLTFDEIEHAVRQQLPGAGMHHHLGFRYTIEWTKPGESSTGSDGGSVAAAMGLNLG
ncbi:hypothetical protein [Leekyejoonella antrihumi]|uniref:hypothetical protein n=1 Tax=Leekyejoonella antrihumi TaxID=1660198 RepID=UPI001C98DE0D|nr:hypothetical protein [Leekyejoonella antrihumi]